MELRKKNRSRDCPEPRKEGKGGGNTDTSAIAVLNYKAKSKEEESMEEKDLIYLEAKEKAKDSKVNVGYATTSVTSQDNVGGKAKENVTKQENTRTAYVQMS